MNYRTLFHCIEDYYLDNFSTPIELICSELSLQDLAFAPSSAKLLPLMELVLAIAVQCKHKQAYISKMCILPEGAQSQLMVFIQRVLEKSNEASTDWDRAMRAVRREKRLLRLDFDTVKNELIAAYKRLEEASNEKSPSKAKPSEPQFDRPKRLSIRQAADLESIMKAEYEAQISSKSDQILELKRQIAKLEETSASEISRLREEKESSEEQIASLQTVLDHLKRRISESAQLENDLIETKRALEESTQHVKRFEEMEKSLNQTLHSLGVTKDQLKAERDTVFRLQATLAEKDDLMRELSRTEMELREKNGILRNSSEALKKEMEALRRESGKTEENAGGNWRADLGSEMEEKVQRLVDENAVLRACSGEALLVQHYSKELDCALLDKQRAEAGRKLLEKDKHALSLQLKEAELRIEAEKEKFDVVVREKEAIGRVLAQRELEMKAEIALLTQKNVNLMKEKQEIERINDELAASCLEKSTRIKSLQADISLLSSIITEKNEKTTATETEMLLSSPENAQSHLQKLKILELERGLSDKTRELATLTATLSDRDETIATLKDQQEEWMRRFVEQTENSKGKIRTEYERKLEEAQKREQELTKGLAGLEDRNESLLAEWRREERLLAMVVQNLGAELCQHHWRMHKS